MSLRFIGSSLFLSLKHCLKNSCPRKVYSTVHNNQHVKNNIDFRLKIPGILRYSSDSPAKCWQCDYPFKSEFFCQKCKALQEPPGKLNYFQIIGVHESYDINGKELHKKYRDLQNVLHPDRFGNKTEASFVLFFFYSTFLFTVNFFVLERKTNIGKFILSDQQSLQHSLTSARSRIVYFEAEKYIHTRRYHNQFRSWISHGNYGTQWKSWRSLQEQWKSSTIDERK